MSDDVITYVEASWNGQRVFRLHADHIVVEFKFQHTHGAATVELAKLRPVPDQHYVRPWPIKLA